MPSRLQVDPHGKQYCQITDVNTASKTEREIDLNSKSWKLPYSIDDEDLTFDGKPLNMLYEENRGNSSRDYISGPDKSQKPPEEVRVRGVIVDEEEIGLSFDRAVGHRVRNKAFEDLPQHGQRTILDIVKIDKMPPWSCEKLLRWQSWAFVHEWRKSVMRGKRVEKEILIVEGTRQRDLG